MRSQQLIGGIAALMGAAIFIVVVSALQLLQRDYVATQQLMSELALGSYGGWMVVAFAGLGIALFGIQLAIAVLGASPGLRLLLSAAALLFIAAGVFPLGETSVIHITTIATAFVLAVLAMYLFPSSAARVSAVAPRIVSWPLAGGVAASVALGHSLVSMGIGQRLAAACFVVWLIVVGVRLQRA